MVHQPEIELLPWSEQRLLDEPSYRKQIAYLFDKSRFFRDKLRRHGFNSAEDVGGLDDIAALP